MIISLHFVHYVIELEVPSLIQTFLFRHTGLPLILSTQNREIVDH